jgi:hypothetical protein
MPGTTTFAVAFVASFAVATVFEGVFEHSEAVLSAVTVLHVFALSAIVFAWAWFDSSRRGARLSTTQGICLIAFGVLAVPFYLWRARPTAACRKWLVKGLVITGITAVSIGVILVFFSETGI